MTNTILGNTTTQEVSSIVELKTLDIDAGNQVSTLSYDDAYLTTVTPAIGGTLYEITTLALYRIKISDGAWTPDGTKDFYLDNGNVAVDLLADDPSSVAVMKTLDLQAGTSITTQSYYAYSGTVEAKGGASYQIMTAAQFTTLTGIGTADGFGDHVLTNANVAMLIDVEDTDASRYGAPLANATADNSPNIQAYLDRASNVKFVSGDTYHIITSLTQAKDNINIDATGATFTHARVDSGRVFNMGSSAVDSLPNHKGFTWTGGTFNNVDRTQVINRGYIALSGFENFEIKNVVMNDVSNGGIELNSGCHNGLIEGIVIPSMSANSTTRGIWLNGSDATDYASNLVDNSTIARNATALPVGGIRNVTIRKCKITIPSYNIYLMNSRGTTIVDNELDIIGGTLRNITINTYSPFTKVLNNRFASTQVSNNKAILITQFSHDVLIQGNTFSGDWGSAQMIHPTYLAEVQILNNVFECDTTIPIQPEMGASGKVEGNTFSTFNGAAKANGMKCMRIFSIGNSEVSSAGFGDTAGVLNGWTFKNNIVKKRNGGVHISQQTSNTGANEPGLDHIIVSGNVFENFDDVSNSEEYPLFMETIASPANIVYYSYFDNTVTPFANGFEARNKPNNAGGATALELINQSSTTGSGSWTINVTDETKSAGEGQTYATNVGRWVRNGNIVTYTGRVVMSSLGTLTTSERMYILGLPYVANNTANVYWSMSIGRSRGLAITAGVAVTGYMDPSSTTIQFERWSATTGSTDLLLSEFSADGEFMFSGQYEIEDLTP